VRPNHRNWIIAEHTHVAWPTFFYFFFFKIFFPFLFSFFFFFYPSRVLLSAKAENVNIRISYIRDARACREILVIRSCIKHPPPDGRTVRVSRVGGRDAPRRGRGPFSDRVRARVHLPVPAAKGPEGRKEGRKEMTPIIRGTVTCVCDTVHILTHTSRTSRERRHGARTYRERDQNSACDRRNRARALSFGDRNLIVSEQI
jgi:hypothetical protein